jgi:uncharacterized protein (DUF885 family)
MSLERSGTRSAGSQLLAMIETHDPVTASELGRATAPGQLPDVSPSGLEAYRQALGSFAGELAGEPSPDADHQGLAGITHQLLAQLDGHGAWQRNPLRVPETAISAVMTLMTRRSPGDVDALRAMGDLLRDLPAFVRQGRECLDAEQVPPLWVDLAATMASRGAEFLNTDLPRAERSLAELASCAADALTEFRAFLETTVRARAAGTAAAGEARIRSLLESVHFIGHSPSEIMDRGLRLIEETRERLIEAAGSSDWKSGVAQARSRRPDATDLIRTYRLAAERLTAFCDETGLFPTPLADMLIEETPKYLQHLKAYAAYTRPGAFGADQTGRVLITPPQDSASAGNHSFGAIQPIIGHEGMPGHHLQFTIANSQPALVRRLPLGSTLMIEGWGLYVEELLNEVGYYDADARLAQLVLTQLRAVRMVVDVGLHTSEMSVERATELVVEHTGLSLSVARSEVWRYTTAPTQQLSYLYGAEELRSQRSAFLARTGTDLRQFHDLVLARGHLPPTLFSPRRTESRT